MSTKQEGTTMSEPSTEAPTTTPDAPVAADVAADPNTEASPLAEPETAAATDPEDVETFELDEGGTLTRTGAHLTYALVNGSQYDVDAPDVETAKTAASVAVLTNALHL